MAKFIFSACSFWWSHFRKGAQEPDLHYLLGFKTAKFHAGLVYQNEFYHYKNADAKEEVDSIFKLEPEAFKTIPKTTIRLPVGSGNSHSKDDILQFLRTCGKCHNWAVITIYHLSKDKFFSLGLLLLLRWETWIIWICGALLYLFDHDILHMIEFSQIAIFFYDTLNLNPGLAKKNNITKETSKEVNKFILLIIITAVLKFCLFGISTTILYAMLICLTLVLDVLMYVTFKPNDQYFEAKRASNNARLAKKFEKQELE